MKRIILAKLREWRNSKYRKPIILRGARQVGKTHLIQQLGKDFENFVSINFEKQPAAAAIFAGDLSPKRLIRDLEFFTDKKIIPGKTLLFLDEAQEMPRALIALRYFYEECPDLHVIAAGSLLDFAIEQVGVPVGRVSFLYLFPMSFVEFLLAMGRNMAVKALLEHNSLNAMNEPLHSKFLEYVAEYIAVGGMPEVVNSWRENQNMVVCNEIQSSIIESYRQDFEKYSKKHQIKYVSLIFENVPHQMGKIFQFSHLPGNFRKRDLAPCYDLLKKALVIKPIYHTDGQGIPLGAQLDFNCFKTLFVDIALSQKILGLHPKDWFLQPTSTLINSGNIVECFVGQELLAYSAPNENPELFFWRTHKIGHNAEVDYLMNIGREIIPIEVKSGLGSTLKSMHIFLKQHTQSPYGVRFSTHNYSKHDRIHSYPLYSIAAFMSQRYPELISSIEQNL